MIDRLITNLPIEEAQRPSVAEEGREISAASSWSRGVDSLALLLEGHQLARQLRRDPWDLAVELSELQRGGLSRNALRWLVCEQYVRHATEIDARGDGGRTFLLDSSSETLRFTEDSCFVLTEEGISFAYRLLETLHRREESEPANGTRQDMANVLTTPNWDCLRQELRLGDVVVKRFKVRASNQERVLSAFEEEGWPPCIDDPLPRRADLDPKRRLHETINSLNRSQKHRLIRFMGNGKGEGIAWELA